MCCFNGLPQDPLGLWVAEVFQVKETNRLEIPLLYYVVSYGEIGGREREKRETMRKENYNKIFFGMNRKTILENMTLSASLSEIFIYFLSHFLHFHILNFPERNDGYFRDN